MAHVSMVYKPQEPVAASLAPVIATVRESSEAAHFAKPPSPGIEPGSSARQAEILATILTRTVYLLSIIPGGWFAFTINTT